jgi:flagellar hook-length control protein FliK
MLQQVESGIRWMLRNAASGAELQLHPEALGRVRIELKVEGGEVHAKLWASDPKSIPVLQENKAFLEVSLKEQGLNLGSFDLRQHSQQPQPQHTEGHARGQFWPTEARPVDRGQDAPTGTAPIDLNARRIELIA